MAGGGRGSRRRARSDFNALRAACEGGLWLFGWDEWKGDELPRRLAHVLRHLVEEARGGEPPLVGADEECEILGHEAGFDGLHADLLERGGEARELGVVVELGAMGEAARPGEDRGDRIG